MLRTHSRTLGMLMASAFALGAPIDAYAGAFEYYVSWNRNAAIDSFGGLLTGDAGGTGNLAQTSFVYSGNTLTYTATDPLSSASLATIQSTYSGSISTDQDFFKAYSSSTASSSWANPPSLLLDPVDLGAYANQTGSFVDWVYFEPDATHAAGSIINVKSVLSLSTTFTNLGATSCTEGTVSVSLTSGFGANLSLANDVCDTATKELVQRDEVEVGGWYLITGLGTIHTEAAVSNSPSESLLWYGTGVSIDATHTGSLGFESPVAITAASGAFYRINGDGNGGETVPEPSALALLGLGLAGLAASRRRKG